MQDKKENSIWHSTVQIVKWYIRYFKYVLKHKYYVWLACFDMWLYRQWLIHDYTKFFPCEYKWYMRYYSLWDKSIQDKFYYARLHHQRNNPHHRQYRLLQEDNWWLKALDMPEKYIKEMLCDWWWVGKCFNNSWFNRYQYEQDKRCEVKRRYKDNKDKIILSENTRLYVELFLSEK